MCWLWRAEEFCCATRESRRLSDCVHTHRLNGLALAYLVSSIAVQGEFMLIASIRWHYNRSAKWCKLPMKYFRNAAACFWIMRWAGGDLIWFPERKIHCLSLAQVHWQPFITVPLEFPLGPLFTPHQLLHPSTSIRSQAHSLTGLCKWHRNARPSSNIISIR